MPDHVARTAERRAIPRVPVGMLAVGGTLLLIVVGWAVLLQTIAREESAAIAEAAENNANLARAFRENALRTFEQVDLISRTIAAEIARGRRGSLDLARYQQDLVADRPYIIQVVMIGADGIGTASANPSSRTYVGDREYFRALVEEKDGRLKIGKPVFGRFSKRWLIPAGRRLSAADGSFAGAVLISVDPQYFRNFYQTVSPGRSGSARLLRKDGTVMVGRSEPSGAQIGESVSPTGWFRQTRLRDSGWAISAGATTGVRRIIAFESVNEYSVLVTAESSLEDVLAPIRGRETSYYIVAFVASAGLLSASLLIAWLFRVLVRANRALRESRDKAETLLEERTQAEEALRRLNAELEDRVARRTAELERTNKELESFAYSVSHDLRAPLRAIAGFSEFVLANEGDRLGAESIHHLKRVQAGVARMGSLIEDLLRLSRVSRQDMNRRDFDLSGLARQVVAALMQEHPGRSVAVTVEPGIATNGDPRLIRIVLENLLGNAWKFTSRATNARIAFGREERDGEQAYYVRDNGAGFDAQFADRLFGAFQRLHRQDEFEGTGVGLSIVQRIVARHGGRVWAEGRVGEGATFAFSLGRAAASPFP